ncbi:hypothetical protein K490DRAFT_63604 [Saccharata proteae CBS 121410]|uniref:AA1-like domain-containing protein n=1 Tax=Saccharata proteae CBS 121410 TaxID=1314787 RepID=A0A6A5YCR9_9PEZI|nr:hypothetical protein K490DRAFT_63604 [Saccharata proteae CBS 121410]
MKFITAIAAFAGAAAALTTEQVKVSDISIRDNDGIQAASFKLNGTIDCSLDKPKSGSCSNKKYNFGINGTDSDYTLSLYHELGLAAGIWGHAKAPVVCRAGGNGPDDFVCSQVDDLTMKLSFNGQ